jgi:hypothetical protein
MTRTSTTIIRRATTKPYILGIPTYPHLLPSLRGPLRPAWAGASLSYLILGISVHNEAPRLEGHRGLDRGYAARHTTARDHSPQARVWRAALNSQYGRTQSCYGSGHIANLPDSQRVLACLQKD